jgi:hypothetical protein
LGLAEVGLYLVLRLRGIAVWIRQHQVLIFRAAEITQGGDHAR